MNLATGSAVSVKMKEKVGKARRRDFCRWNQSRMSQVSEAGDETEATVRDPFQI